MPSPKELLEAVRALNLPQEDWQEVERRLTKKQPTAADFAFVKAVIRNFVLNDISTEVSTEEAEAFIKAEEAAASMAIASLKSITDDIDTLATDIRHD